ncbi:hypothetical protein ACIQB5_42365 [Streptomyces sp. NPDC088560]
MPSPASQPKRDPPHALEKGAAGGRGIDRVVIAMASANMIAA